MKVLLVDDDACVRGGLRRVLAAAGYDVLEASDGAAALLLLREEPHVVICDFELPDRPGVDIVRCSKLKRADAFVVAISGDMSEDRVRELAAAGAAACIDKTTAASELLVLLQRAYEP